MKTLDPGVKAQLQKGVRCLAPGHFNMKDGVPWHQTSDLCITAPTGLPPAVKYYLGSTLASHLRRLSRCRRVPFMNCIKLWIERASFFPVSVQITSVRVEKGACCSGPAGSINGRPVRHQQPPERMMQEWISHAPSHQQNGTSAWS